MRILLFLLLALAAPACGFAQTRVHDLDSVRKAIKDKQGKSSFDAQIVGKNPQGLLGSRLPKGISRADVVRLVAPHADPKRIILVGAVAWPSATNAYVGIVCAAHDKSDARAAGSAPACDQHPDVYIGVFAFKPGAGAPRLIARTRPGFALTSKWGAPRGAPALTPSVAPAQLDASTLPDDWQWPAHRSDEEAAGFDFAPYRIAPHVLAFGLRSNQIEGYSGGYGTFQSLHLFIVDGARLRRVLTQPIYAMRMTAGDWNRDGTRQHSIEESKIVLTIEHKLIAGHYAILLHEVGTTNSALLRWSAAAQAYRPTKPAGGP